MNNDEIKKLLITILDEDNISVLCDKSSQQAFISGEQDVVFSDLDIDSLTSMELCIAIEVELGVSIVPEQLSQLRSLNGLVDEIHTHLS